MNEHLDDLANRALKRHQAALQILRENDAERVPFVLYLRKFDIHILHGPTELDRELGEVAVQNDLPAGCRLITVQQEPKGEQIRSSLSDKVAALVLEGTKDWKGLVEALISRAELIISEFQFLSEGVRWELETCRALGKHHQTVLILPPANSQFSCLDHLSPLDQFPRVIWANQLFNERISENFVAQDLFVRIAAIAGLSLDERRKIYTDDEMRRKFRVTYEGVLEGYKSRLNKWEVQAALGEESDVSYYRFWDRLREAWVIGILVKELETLSLEQAAFDLAYAYIEVLQGMAYGVVALDQEGSYLTTTKAQKMAASLHPIIDNISGVGPGIRALRSYADMTLARLGYSTST
jgi:hypothetical protein